MLEMFAWLRDSFSFRVVNSDFSVHSAITALFLLITVIPSWDSYYYQRYYAERYYGTQV